MENYFVGSKKHEKYEPRQKPKRFQQFKAGDVLSLGEKLIQAAAVLNNLGERNVALSRQDISRLNKINDALKSSNRILIGDKKPKKAARNKTFKLYDEILIRTLFPKIKAVLSGVLEGKPKFDHLTRCELIGQLLYDEGLPYSGKITDEVISEAAITDDTLEIFLDDDYVRSDELSKESLAILFGETRARVNRAIYPDRMSLFNYLERTNVKGSSEYLTLIDILGREARHVQELKKSKTNR